MVAISIITGIISVLWLLMGLEYIFAHDSYDYNRLPFHKRLLILPIILGPLAGVLVVVGAYFFISMTFLFNYTVKKVV